MNNLKQEFYEKFIQDEEYSFVKGEKMLDTYILWTKQKIKEYVNRIDISGRNELTFIQYPLSTQNVIKKILERKKL